MIPAPGKGRLALGVGLVLFALSVASGGGAQDAPKRLQSTDELVSRMGPTIDVANHPGKALFDANCLACHSGGVPKAPAVVWLEMLAPDAILASMNGGIMSQQAAHLSVQQRREVAEYITRTPLADYRPPAPPKACAVPGVPVNAAPPARLGWGHDNRRFVPAAAGGMAIGDAAGLSLKWAFAFPASNRARSQPAIGWDSVFVGSQDGTVHAFDLASGCSRWTFRASAEVRTAIIADPAARRLYFGDVLGRAYALDAATGKELWRTKVDDHPNATITGSPALGGGLLYVPVSSLEVTSASDPGYACCTFRGSVTALDPATGKVRWQSFTVPKTPVPFGKTSAGTDILGPSGAPVWNSPTYDAKRGWVLFGSGENYASPADANSDAVFAVNARTGRRIWSTQLTARDAWNVGCMMGNANCPVEAGPDYDLGASVLMVPLGKGRDVVVAGQKSGVVYGLDPRSGRILWSRRVGHGGTQGGVHFGMAAEGSTVYVPVVDMPDTGDGRVYDAKLNGAGIHAIDAASGKLLWSNKADNVCNGRKHCDSGISAAATAFPGGVIAGHLDGRLRAYDGRTGRVVWNFDTTLPMKTIDGTQATGGSMSGGGAAIAGGFLVANSGYGLYQHMPGNVLMVFGKAN